MQKAPSTAHLLQKLRSFMKASSAGPLSAYIVPSGDAHQSEYIAECDTRRKFISKFSGSAGTAIITTDKAALWTDGRYHNQASQQLDLNSWILMKEGLPETPTKCDWLKDCLATGAKVGVDPLLISHDVWKVLSKELRSSNIQLVAVEENLIDKVWEDKSIHVDGVDSEKPPRPCNNVITLSDDLTGLKWQSKISDLRSQMIKKKVDSIILTNLDDIAWLFNLRGSDIDFNPVFFAYSIVTQQEIYLFIDKKKLSTEVLQFINSDSADVDKEVDSKEKVSIKSYESIIGFINNNLIKRDGLIWVSERASEAIVLSVPKSKRFNAPNPIAAKKCVKNEIEIQSMKNAHIKDAAALIEYLAWLEAKIESHPDGHDDLWEISGADYLEACRKEQPKFMGLSFPSISSSGPNGAVIHYHPEIATNRPIGKKELYLIDSGAQYLDGTTDVTRTVHYGEPTAYQKECFTRVLKGHIQLAMAIFPKKARGTSLDGYARKYLWQEGLDYMHGTGHGVGMFLNVHEGPCSISPRSHPDDTGITEGMILSNEPGFYEEGEFGIRIESLIIACPAETRYNFKNQGYLKFETITLVPIQLKMIDVSLLSDKELEWLNNYHDLCRTVVGEYLDKTGKIEVRKWLEKETTKLIKN